MKVPIAVKGKGKTAMNLAAMLCSWHFSASSFIRSFLVVSLSFFFIFLIPYPTCPPPFFLYCSATFFLVQVRAPLDPRADVARKKYVVMILKGAMARRHHATTLYRLLVFFYFRYTGGTGALSIRCRVHFSRGTDFHAQGRLKIALP